MRLQGSASYVFIDLLQLEKKKIFSDTLKIKNRNRELRL